MSQDATSRKTEEKTALPATACRLSLGMKEEPNAFWNPSKKFPSEDTL